MDSKDKFKKKNLTTLQIPNLVKMTNLELGQLHRLLTQIQV